MKPRLEFTFENGEFEMQLIFGLMWNLRWKWWRDIECLLKCESNVHGQGQGKRCDLGIQQRVAQRWKNPRAMQETQIWSLSQEDPLEKKMATHSSILWGQHYPNTNISQREILLYKEGKPQMNLRRQWHPTPVLLPGNSHGRRSLVGFSP